MLTRDARDRSARLQKIEQLQSHQQHTGDIERQLAGKIAETELLAEQLKNVNEELAPVLARSETLSAGYFPLSMAVTRSPI